MTRIGTDKSDLVNLRQEIVSKSNFKRNVINFRDQDSWAVTNGAISHKSTGFFHVLGLSSTTALDENIILYQPQSALTGILLARKDGRIWICLQARAEPGNVGIVQYGPTIQSTAANYMKLHGGKDTDFLSHFQSYPGGSTLLSFTMQTDLGELYYQKSKTHNYVEVSDFVSASENTIWCPLNTICSMATENYFLNTDLRSLISMFDWDYYHTGEYVEVAPNSSLIEFYFAQKNKLSNHYKLTPLDKLKTWEITDFGLKSKQNNNRYVELYNIQANTREVSNWVQPLVGTTGDGCVRLYRRIHKGTPQYLVSVINEYGINGGAIIAPSELIYPGGDIKDEDAYSELYRTFEHSEEGGRFINHSSVFEIRNVGTDFQFAENQFWVSAAQLKQLFQGSNMVAIQLRVIASALVDELNPDIFGNSSF